jgi:molecular chaperone GrpE
LILTEDKKRRDQPAEGDLDRERGPGGREADRATDRAGEDLGTDGQPRQANAPEAESLPADYEETRRERDQFRALAQRVQADFVNYRKRVDAEREDVRRQANRDLLLKLLPVLDGLYLALREEVTRDVDQKWVEGVRAVRRSLDSVLGPEGVEAFGQVGERFDPRLHEAIARIPAAGAAPDTVLKVHRVGYRLHGDVIRPALVEIAASPPDDSAGQSANADRI